MGRSETKNNYQLVTEDTYDEWKLKLLDESYYKEKSLNQLNCKFWFLLAIYMLLSVFNIFLLFYNHSFFHFLKILFLDKNNTFQWSGVTATVAIISFTCTLIVTVRRNRADLVSKSRIDWLRKNKKIMSNYLELNYKFFKIFDNWRVNGDIESSTYENEKRVLLELETKIEKEKYLLLLNLSDNDDNKQINNCILICSFWIEDLRKNHDKGISQNCHNHYKPIPILNLLKVSRDYYKREWDKAKKGK